MTEPMMQNPARARLIPVNGPNDSPAESEAITVQFNPTSLKVALSNTLRANPREGSSRSAQFVDKSSSSLTVELLFDTTVATPAAAAGAGNPGGSEAVDAGSDVRRLTRRIAEKFLKPVESGDELQAPKRCLFQWGAFEFVGLVQSFDETLDFFSPEGRPLRASVALKLSEDRFQFRSRDVEAAERNTPTLTATGAAADDPDAGGDGDGNRAPVAEANREAGRSPRDWRDTALFNGIENPRLPGAAALAVPRASLNVAGSAIQTSFRFGASARIGTTIPGAFDGPTAASLASGAVELRGGGVTPSAAGGRSNSSEFD